MTEGNIQDSRHMHACAEAGPSRGPTTLSLNRHGPQRAKGEALLSFGAGFEDDKKLSPTAGLQTAARRPGCVHSARDRCFFT